jgi:hypothetical protein
MHSPWVQRMPFFLSAFLQLSKNFSWNSESAGPTGSDESTITT